MSSQNIFDLFGRQKKKNDVEEIVTENMLDVVKILVIKNDEMINKKIAEMTGEFEKSLQKFRDHIKKTEHLLSAISLKKYYLGVNKRRIVNVSKSIDNNDVVIKSELNEVLDAVIKVGNDIKILEKKIRDDFQMIVDGTNAELKTLNRKIVKLNQQINHVEERDIDGDGIDDKTGEEIV